MSLEHVLLIDAACATASGGATTISKVENETTVRVASTTGDIFTVDTSITTSEIITMWSFPHCNVFIPNAFKCQWKVCN
jgi:hypothetical protein